VSCTTRSTQSGRPRTGEDAPVYGTVGAAPMIAGSAGVGAMPRPWYLSLAASGPKASTAESGRRHCTALAPRTTSMPLEDFLIAPMPGHITVSAAPPASKNTSTSTTSTGRFSTTTCEHSPAPSPTSRHPRTNCADSTGGARGRTQARFLSTGRPGTLGHSSSRRVLTPSCLSGVSDHLLLADF
jgi:hypothetical protein